MKSVSVAVFCSSIAYRHSFLKRPFAREKERETKKEGGRKGKERKGEREERERERTLDAEKNRKK